MIPRYTSGLSPKALTSLRAQHALLTCRRPLVLASQLQRQARWSSKKWKKDTTSTTGADKSGHIGAAPNESILWLDNLFPLRLSGLLRAPWSSPDQDLSELMNRFENSSLGITNPINLVKRAIPQDVPVKITEILPRIKDGGAFVKFTHPPNLPAREVEEAVSSRLQETPVKPFFSPFRGVHAGLVKGVPWLEDLHRFPSSRLRVEFVPINPGEEAIELSQETLYSLFRRYGKIAEITSQPWDSKVLPKYAHIDFALARDAIMARNCLHGFVVPEELGGGKSGTKFRMYYEEKANTRRFWSWITGHPRIVIPILVALLTGFTVVVFDPIRSFFVKVHISGKYRLSNSTAYRWLRKQTSDISDIFTFRQQKVDQAGLDAIWTHRKDLIDQIQKWLMETAETFIVVQGPRGSGKKELVLDQALKGRGNVLVIDCKPIAEARGETATIGKLAAAVGYRPVFSWANSMSSLADLAVQSTTGVKAGFSETLESQVQKILHTAAGALQDIDVSNRHRTDSDASLPDDVYLESHPERRAVVVIDNFLHKNDTNAIVYEKIAEWAAALVQSNVAHVIFLTDDTSYSKSLSKSLPDRIFRHAALGDLSPEVAKRFVLGHVANDTEPKKPGGSGEKKAPKPKPKIDLEELDECIGTLGGRLTDLEFLARRLKTGQTPKQAIADITEQSASEILKMFLLPGKTTTIDDHKWSVEQAWYLVKALASGDSLRYNEVLLSSTFASSLTAPDGESALEGLASTELISVTLSHGRPQKITPGRPVYQAAFRYLAGDPVFAAKMDLAVLTELVKIEAKNIDKAESELALLGTLPRQPAQTAARASYLLTKLESAQKRVEVYEREMSGLKKLLTKEY
ncbi:RNA12 protein-domain-containing protein [Camillea tinctor]|nr:RNA12 protein-domain-containing protein [Camillea tinctor]